MSIPLSSPTRVVFNFNIIRQDIDYMYNYFEIAPWISAL
jgi:hypothetical protein